VNTELTEFSHDTWNTPADVSAGKLLDKILDFFGDGWTAWLSTVTERGPNSHGNAYVATP
jgi:hypothetical protein